MSRTRRSEVEWITPEGMPFERLRLLIEVYESVSNRPRAIEVRLEQLWAEFDRRMEEAA